MDRDKLYLIIDEDNEDNKASRIYNYVMIFAIIASLVPLAFKVREQSLLLFIIDKVTVILFIADYILRLFTADKQLKKGKASFFIYPFTFMAIIDLLSILPSITILASGFKLLRMFRLLRAFRVLKAFKIFRYSKSISIIADVIKRQKDALIAVGTFAVGYILVSALIIFNVEPTTFNSFFDAVYWATVSLVTVGYGDIYPVTTAGRLVTMISSFIGIAIIALPSGVITAGYLEEIKKKNNSDDDTKEQ
ncbi:MAG: ion transporter [Eubacterium sp.]|nr:ion transporter [Eubacterium sp.]